MRLAAFALGVSGFVALVYEVIWTRILAMVLGPTTYAFSAMLVAFIAGLAIGAAVAAALLPRTRHPGAWLGVALLTAAAAALAAALAVDRLPLLMASAVTGPDTTFGSVMALQVGLGIAMLLPMTIALGAAFPLAIAHVSPGVREVAREVGIVYAANTVGAIAGALAGSFVLVPALGLQMSLRVSAAVTCITGAVVCWRTLPRRAARRAAAATGAAGIVAAVALPSWNQERLANGAYRYAPSLAAGDLETGLEAGHLLYYREGAAGTVSVRQLPGVRALAIDGKVDASNAEDMATQKLLAHLPLHAAPGPATGAHHRARQRRHARLGASTPDRARERPRDFAGGCRRVGPLRAREPAGADRRAGSRDRGRRPVAPAALARPVRRHHLRAVQSVDGGSGRAVHPRVRHRGA